MWWWEKHWKLCKCLKLIVKENALILGSQHKCCNSAKRKCNYRGYDISLGGALSNVSIGWLAIGDRYLPPRSSQLSARWRWWQSCWLFYCEKNKVNPSTLTIIQPDSHISMWARVCLVRFPNPLLLPKVCLVYVQLVNPNPDHRCQKTTQM